ncbi:hypothetical protein Fmac_020364 [Flemingia macrophylla]|uniref:Major facilitator superfamily (MFS) profile domain-containing protein n=1 Tax=Flemingia macrophylla TaxID=520843 RepID=A0ABD1LTT7_9FABA
MLIRTCSFPIAPLVLVFRLFSSCRAVLVVFLLLRFFGCGHPLVFLQSKSSGRVLCLSWLVLGLGRLRRKRWMWLGLRLGLGIRVRNFLWMIWYIVERWMGKRMNRMEEGVVNEALEYLAKDLGITDNTLFYKFVKRWIFSALLVGATVGSFTGGALGLCFLARSVETMIIGRLLVGITIGVASAIVPLYIYEISPTEIRGALGFVDQLFICIGFELKRSWTCAWLEKEWVGELLHYSPVVCDMSAIALPF